METNHMIPEDRQDAKMLRRRFASSWHNIHVPMMMLMWPFS